MKLSDIPRQEKPRERLARLGPSALSDRELVAMVLRTGGRGRNALELADELLASASGLAPLMSSRLEDLEAIKNLGPAKAAGLLAVFELGRRASIVQDLRPVIEGPDDLAEVCVPLLSGKPYEEALVVVLNSGNRVLKVVCLSSGSTSRCLMLPRDVLAAVLRSDGVAFAMAHNHPSGEPTPSREDVKATRAIDAAAEVIGLRFVDHIIVGSRNWHSLARMNSGT